MSENQNDTNELNDRVKFTVYINVYNDGHYDYRMFASREIADLNVLDDSKRFACVTLTLDVEEGYGL